MVTVGLPMTSSVDVWVGGSSVTVGVRVNAAAVCVRGANTVCTTEVLIAATFTGVWVGPAEPPTEQELSNTSVSRAKTTILIFIAHLFWKAEMVAHRPCHHYIPSVVQEATKNPAPVIDGAGLKGHAYLTTLITTVKSPPNGLPKSSYMCQWATYSPGSPGAYISI